MTAEADRRGADILPTCDNYCMITRTFRTCILKDDKTTMTAVPLPFDPKEVFGKVRAPVIVTIGKHSYRSTVCLMGGACMVPLRRSNREAAGVRPGEAVRVTLKLDEAPRTVEPPADLARALRRGGMLQAFRAMSFTHQREHAEAVEGAKKPETRERRIRLCVERVQAMAPKTAARRSKASRKG